MPSEGGRDTAKGPTSLRVENYAHGSDAALDSWVVLERKEGATGGAASRGWYPASGLAARAEGLRQRTTAALLT